MGKKSVMDTPLLRSPEDQGVNSVEVSLPAEQTSLFQEFLRLALKAQMDTEESRLKDQVRTEDSVFATFFYNAHIFQFSSS